MNFWQGYGFGLLTIPTTWAIAGILTACFTPFRKQDKPVQIKVETQDFLITPAEIVVLATSPEALDVLIDWHDRQESEADAVGAHEATIGHMYRRRELERIKALLLNKRSES
jgi:hypothetical protein